MNGGEPIATLNRFFFIVSHIKFMPSMLIFIMKIYVDHINFQPMLNFHCKISMGHNNCFSKKLVKVVVLFCPTFVL